MFKISSPTARVPSLSKMLLDYPGKIALTMTIQLMLLVFYFNVFYFLIFSCAEQNRMIQFELHACLAK